MLRKSADGAERDMQFSQERDVEYSSFAGIYYLELIIIFSVGGFHKPSLPKLAGTCVKFKATIKSISSYCIHSYSLTIGDKV